jgi:hypothetical protein
MYIRGHLVESTALESRAGISRASSATAKSSISDRITTHHWRPQDSSHRARDAVSFHPCDDPPV